MLPEEQNNINNNEQSDVLLDDKKIENYEIPLWKRIVLFVVGLGGLFLIGIIVGLIAKFTIHPDYQDAITNLVAYVILFVALILIVLFDIPRYAPMFKKWQPYLIGIGVAIAIILFDIFYTTILYFSYPDYKVGGNETDVRSIIDIAPIGAIFILGIIGPICEELTYRVGLFGALKKLNIVLAYILSSLIFAAIHFRFNAANIYVELANLPAYLVSGVALAIAYDKCGFTCSATAHIANNLYAVIANIILKNIH